MKQPSTLSWRRSVAGLGLLLALLPGWVAATPEIQHWTTANGARVYFVSAPELPMIDVQVVFDAGAARDGGVPGLAQLTNLLLDSGTGSLSADAVAERLDEAGAQLDGGAERDMAWLSLRSLSDPQYLSPSLETLAALLREPAFEPQSLERERQRMISAVRAGNQDPEAVADRAFMQALYGNHPYATSPEGTELSLNAITRDNLHAFHDRYYVAANAVVAVVGDLDRAGAEDLVNTVIGALPRGESAPPLPEPSALGSSQLMGIRHPSSQSHVMIGQLGIARGHPDYFALYLGNHVLGGSGLVSLLAREVRERRGLSYSVYSYFSPQAVAGPFVMGLQTRNDQVDQAVRVAGETLTEFVNKGPDPTELEAARQNITGGFALRLDSNAKIAQYLSVIGFYGLPLDYLDNFRDRINGVTRRQVMEAFSRLVHPDRQLTVIVGGQQ